MYIFKKFTVFLIIYILLFFLVIIIMVDLLWFKFYRLMELGENILIGVVGLYE